MDRQTVLTNPIASWVDKRLSQLKEARARESRGTLEAAKIEGAIEALQQLGDCLGPDRGFYPQGYGPSIAYVGPDGLVYSREFLESAAHLLGPVDGDGWRPK